MFSIGWNIIRVKGILSQATAWMNLQDIMLGEKSQPWEVRVCPSLTLIPLDLSHKVAFKSPGDPQQPPHLAALQTKEMATSVESRLQKLPKWFWHMAGLRTQDLESENLISILKSAAY